jgi:exopolyphosphatase/guanosine-5'-triphosphate,3'-diphosphate pyrophosphatase
MPFSHLLAAVDLGSNSFRLVIGRIESTLVGDQIRPIDQIKETVRLAAGLSSTGTLSEPAQERAIAALHRFGERLRAFRPDAVRAVATNTFRVASHTRAFLERSQEALGFPIEVIAGREEARLIYLGAAHALPTDSQRRLIIDIGGGSTECIIGTDYRSELLESVPLGCVGLANQYFPDGNIDRHNYQRARLACRDALSPLSKLYREFGWRTSIGTSGTAKTLWQIAQVDFGDSRLTADALAMIETTLLKAGHADRLRLDGLKPDRRPVIAGGLAMMSAAFEEFGIESMDYCDGALREGVLYDLLGRSTGADTRSVTVAQMIRRYALDERYGQAVASLATTFYRDAMRASDDELARSTRMLAWAAQLCETGMSIAHADYHKHGGYILSHCDMPGFSEDEQTLIANLVLGQTGGLTKLKSCLFGQNEWVMVLCLRLAVIFHRRRDGQLPPSVKLRVKSGGGRIELDSTWADDHPLTNQSLQFESAEWSKAGPWGLNYLLS